MTTSYDTSQDSAGVTTQTLYDSNGTESIIQTYNVGVGQAPLDIEPEAIPGGEYVVLFKIANIDSANNDYIGAVDDVFDDQYKLSIQYGQETTSLIATSLANGTADTIATVHDVATMLINGQWEPVTGPLTIYGLENNGLDLDTGPKILTDQSGGPTTSQTLSLSGNVVHYLPGEYLNFADGEVVNIADNGVQVAASTIQSVNEPGTQRYLGPNDTAWDASINLTPGDNQITITTTDRNGLTGSASLDYVYTPSGSGPGGGGTPTGGGGTIVTPPPPPVDAVSIDPAVTFLGRGAFQLTGQVSSTAGVSQVELSADVDGVTTDLGAADVNADGSFTFTDHVGAHGQSFITATLTDGDGQTLSADSGFNLRAGIGGRSYVAVQNVYDPATGDIASSSLFHQDGSRTVRIDEADLTLASGSSDTFLNGGQPDNIFVFQPGYGADVVQGFLATGADHDTLSLPRSDFASIAQILRDTRQAPGGAVIHDPASGDTIQLAGISKTEFTRHRGDFTLHG